MKHASTNTDQEVEGSAVVGKKDASTQTEFEKECEDLESPTSKSRASDEYDSDATIDYRLESSDGSYTDIHELDPEPCYSSQACSGLHGASYTPPAWRRQRVKRKKLMATPKESEEDTQN